MNEDQIWDNFQFEEPTERPVGLPTLVMKHICQLLIDKKDKYEACLIHPNWSIAAMEALWEAPRFERSQQLRDFTRAVSTSKKTALLVRNFYLAYLDVPEETVFKTIVHSTMERHMPSNVQILAEPKLLLLLARHCENITSITCYGWQLESGDWEQLSMLATQLVQLHIIGSRPNKQLNVNSFLPRLTSLHLDGSFGLNEAWATTLINKAINLIDLQLSLKDMEFNTLKKICTPGHLKLDKLALTEAHKVRDIDVRHVLHAFPNLTKFCLEGCTLISPQTVLISLISCNKLQHLEIRADPISLDKVEPVLLNEHHPEWIPPLTKLLIENLNIVDQNLQYISNFLPCLQVLGLKGCPQITNEGLMSIINNPCIKHISQLNLVECPSIHSGFFSIDTLTITTYIKEIYIKSCGPVLPADIYKLCCKHIGYRLNSIKLINYQDLKDSAIGAFSKDQEDLSRIILDRDAIHAIAHSNDPAICSLPEDHLLSGNQIILLAKRLNMTTQELIVLFEEIEQEDKMLIHQKTKAQPCISSKNKSINVANLTTKNNSNQLEAPNSPLFPRPAMPAILPKGFTDNGPFPANNSDCMANGLMHPLSDTDFFEEVKEKKETQDSDCENKCNNDYKDDDSFNNTKNKQRSSLGAWGIGENNDSLWNNASYSEFVLQAESETTWAEARWLEQQQINNRHKNDTLIIEGDGWGTPNKIIEWDDLSIQGYAHEVLEEQKKTLYCEKEEQGQIPYADENDSILDNIENKQASNGTASDDSINDLTSLFSPIYRCAFSDTEGKYASKSIISIVSSDESSDLDDGEDDDDDVVVKVKHNLSPNKCKSFNTNDRNKRKEPLSLAKYTTRNEKKPSRAFNSSHQTSNDRHGSYYANGCPDGKAKEQWASITKAYPVTRKFLRSARTKKGNSHSRGYASPERLTNCWKQPQAKSLGPHNNIEAPLQPRQTRSLESLLDLNIDSQITLSEPIFCNTTADANQTFVLQPTSDENNSPIPIETFACTVNKPTEENEKEDEKSSNLSSPCLVSDISTDTEDKNSINKEDFVLFTDIVAAEGQAESWSEEKNIHPYQMPSHTISSISFSFSMDQSPPQTNTTVDNSTIFGPLAKQPPFATQISNDPTRLASSKDQQRFITKYDNVADDHIPFEFLMNQLTPSTEVDTVTDDHISSDPLMKQLHVGANAEVSGSHLLSQTDALEVRSTYSNNENFESTSTTSNLCAYNDKIPFEEPEDDSKKYKKLPGYLGKSKVLITDKTYKCLYMFSNEPIEVTIKNFCKKYNIEQKEANLIEEIQPKYRLRKTRSILKKKK
ncbi:hypothetical protein G6F44_002415 [Rhizopus delemar]|nr:hypothetical protein G6F44_002415 [Rhizopus delemar]